MLDELKDMMVPFPAGGTGDLFARGAAQALSEEFGQQFAADSRSQVGTSAMKPLPPPPP